MLGIFGTRVVVAGRLIVRGADEGEITARRDDHLDVAIRNGASSAKAPLR
jgi:hypothetical protein